MGIILKKSMEECTDNQQLKQRETIVVKWSVLSSYQCKNLKRAVIHIKSLKCRTREIPFKETIYLLGSVHAIQCSSHSTMCSNLTCNTICVPRIGPRFPNGMWKWSVENDSRVGISAKFAHPGE